MNKVYYLFVVFLAILLVSCEGEQGPMGPAGEDAAYTQVFEVQLSFLEENDYEALVEIPGDIEIYSSDIVMAYVYMGSFDELDIWEPLPQTFYLDEGIVLYGYDFTAADVNFFMDGTVYPGNLGTDWTDNLIFRVAVIPAVLYQSMNIENMDEVLEKAEQLKTIQL